MDVFVDDFMTYEDYGIMLLERPINCFDFCMFTFLNLFANSEIMFLLKINVDENAVLIIGRFLTTAWKLAR